MVLWSHWHRDFCMCFFFTMLFSLVWKWGSCGGKKEVQVLNHNLMTCVLLILPETFSQTALIGWLCGCETWWGRSAAVCTLLYINFGYCLFNPTFLMMPRKMWVGAQVKAGIGFQAWTVGTSNLTQWPNCAITVSHDALYRLALFCLNYFVTRL